MGSKGSARRKSVYVCVVDVSCVLRVWSRAARSVEFCQQGGDWAWRRGKDTLFIHTRFYGIFIVGFGRVLERLAQALRCYCFGFLEFLHLFLCLLRELVRGLKDSGT